MQQRRFTILAVFVLALVSTLWGSELGAVQQESPASAREPKVINDAAGRTHVRNAIVTPAQRHAAALRFKAARAAALAKARKTVSKKTAGAATASATNLAATSKSSAVPATAGLQPAGTVPHYFGPYANWANSPLPKGPIATVTVDAGGSGYTAPTVEISDIYGTGSGATATATLTGDVITGITITNPGSNYSAPFVAISDPTGADALASARIGGTLTGGLQKFVDQLPGLGPNGIPVAEKDTTTYPGSDYYEIALVEFTQKMHRDLPPTKLRGYVQLSTNTVPGARVPLTYLDGTPILVNGVPAQGVTAPRYLGTTIVADKDRPVRVLFRNLLPTGQAGDLFIPVDTTLMGSGMGPLISGNGEMDPQNPMCNNTPKPAGCFAENRATLHLHGGLNPWISDGTPHQWITPAGENTSYPKGVSVSNVPDMPDPGPGAMTFFYTNQQSARLMFYHDHSWGITRLNVYAGEAGPYVLRDDTEKNLIAQNIIPSAEIPLVIQDKTFVDATTIAAQDPTWRWGLDAQGDAVTGSLWVPHVYMPAQNPNDPTGASSFGRWMYGAWFWPPQADLKYPPIANPYYDPACDQDITGWCEPPLIPSTPNMSVGMEAFNDTPIVNGIAYPTTTLAPQPYRFRILNAANDRFWNLQWYVADSTGTEVALKASELAGAQEDPNIFPTPDTSISPEGPNWIQIGTEGGFLPAPVVVKNQPTTWIIDPTRFDVGNVDKHSLLVAPAERADVIVDFSAFAGKTLILYNDAPAAFPARVATYDYYTGDPDMTDAGGAPPTLPGFGPNTRTIMKVVVSGGNGTPFNLGALQAAFAHHLDANGKPAGVFESSQDPIIVAQGAYNSAYGTNFRNTAPRDGFARIADMSLTFNTLLTGNSGTETLTIPFENKGLHDEMNSATFDEYGRMTANLGLESPGATPLLQNIVLYPYVNPATEILNQVTAVGPIATATDGTQIWKLTHNGVDTHPIHFHLFDVQLINRITWDNRVLPPDATELGWKETVRTSPLEDTIVAIRPRGPKLPFGLFDSQRYLNPALPANSPDGFNSIDVNGNAMVPPITNQIVNFGWEYVWHCHILGHEEMDMMRPMKFNAGRALPAAPAVTMDLVNGAISLAWTDGTPINYSATPIDFTAWGNPQNEVGYEIQRASISGGVVGAYSPIGSTLANVTSFTTPVAGSASYRVVAFNAAGNSISAPVQIDFSPATPTGLAATVIAPTQVDLAWAFTDNANAATGFRIERRVGTTGAFTAVGTVAPDQRAYSDTTAPDGRTLNYRVIAFNVVGGDGAPSNIASATTLLAAPANLTGAVTGTAPVRITLTWTDVSTSNTGFTVQRATNSGFTTGLTTFTVTPGTATTYLNNSGLATNSTYFYRVRSTVGATTSAWSATLTIRTVAPAAPTGLTATLANGPAAALAWVDNASNEAGFTIQRALTNAFTTVTTFNVGANVTAYTDTATVSGTTYFYRVRATNGIGASAFSNTVSLLVTGGPVASASPNPVGFGASVLNSTSAPQTITLSNTGVADLLISSVTLGGTNAADFALTNNCGASLAPATTCTMSVTFTPTANGARAAAITISNNSLSAPNLAVPLTGTGATLATMITPAPSSTLTSNSVPFTWNAGSGITTYQLLAGTSVGASNLFNSGNVTATTATATGLPIDGSTVYVRLQSQVGGVFQFVDYTYTAVTAAKAAITSPAPGSTLTNTSATFTWSAGVLATQYQLSVGTTVGASDLFASGNLATTTASVTGLPFDGSTVYVRLQSQINGVWQSNDYTYTAVIIPTKASITSPAPNSVLGGTSVNFTWSGGVQVTSYALWFGTAPNTQDIGNSGVLAPTANSYQATLPANGTSIFVSMWSLINGVWQSNAYVYTASGTLPSKAVMTSPTPNSTLASTNVTFNWVGSGPTQYAIWVGTTAGASDIYMSAALASSVNSFAVTVPATGAPVYVRLWSYLNATWQFNDYVYTASGTLSIASIVSPAPNSTLTGTSVLFSWTGSGPSQYAIWIGTTPGGSNILQSAALASNVFSYLATVPATGAPVYVRMWSLVNGTWVFNDYVYTAFQ